LRKAPFNIGNITLVFVGYSVANEIFI